MYVELCMEFENRNKFSAPQILQGVIMENISTEKMVEFFRKFSLIRIVNMCQEENGVVCIYKDYYR